MNSAQSAPATSLSRMGQQGLYSRVSAYIPRRAAGGVRSRAKTRVCVGFPYDTPLTDVYGQPAQRRTSASRVGKEHTNISCWVDAGDL